jgi:outer membrane protein W
MRRLLPLLALLSALPLAAQTSLGISIARSHTGSTNAEGGTLAFDRGRGFGVSVDHLWSGGALSTELAATWLRYDGTLRLDPTSSADLGRLRLVPVTATAQWHFARDERIDPYVGAGAAYVFAKGLSSSDLDALGIGSIAVENKACWLANAGVALHLRDAAIVVDGKYLDYRPDSGPSDSRVRLKLKPVVISAGIRWRL